MKRAPVQLYITLVSKGYLQVCRLCFQVWRDALAREGKQTKEQGSYLLSCPENLFSTQPGHGSPAQRLRLPSATRSGGWAEKCCRRPPTYRQPKRCRRRRQDKARASARRSAHTHDPSLLQERVGKQPRLLNGGSAD